MMPYVWPKGNFTLQFTVLFCLVLLALGRALNVLVPIYSKEIGQLYKLSFFDNPILLQDVLLKLNLHFFLGVEGGR